MKKDFDKKAITWDEEPARVKLANDIAGAISDEITLNPSLDVLDFGCGTGLLTLRLSPMVRSITGVDSSQGMLGVLNSKIGTMKLTNAKTQYLDLEKGDVLEGRYNLIVSSMTFHHIKAIGPLLNRFYHVSTHPGHLCIADLDLDDGQFHGNNDGVFHFGFDRAELRKAFMEAGFRDIRDRTAARVLKPTPDGSDRLFTVFLMTGRK
ncbi:MAG TPA: class I SAM-dependent methyltransferase [Desulfomonilia bacterium]|nr:class I SAM-dependent methyltransferase [Desulfomonilia bacterium]